MEPAKLREYLRSLLKAAVVGDALRRDDCEATSGRAQQQIGVIK
jgi:hypothetical protein